MRKYKLIQFLRELGLYKPELGKRIDETKFNIEDIILVMVSNLLNLSQEIVRQKFEDFECNYE